ncbi:MAG TPA: VCBS repeat-containing protein [Bryobacteraceae bacterium]|nr:VCBS repeat-containing protein [Bryobacteraceae bacterium]
MGLRARGAAVPCGCYDGDGSPDIYVACDTSPSLYFRNNHDGTFSEQGLERGFPSMKNGKG